MLNRRLTAGQAAGYPQAGYLLAPPLAPACEVVADSDALRRWIAAAGAQAVIAPTPGRKQLPHFDPLAYAKRRPSKQAFGSLRQHCRLAARYDKLDTVFEAFVWACARITTRYLN